MKKRCALELTMLGLGLLANGCFVAATPADTDDAIAADEQALESSNGLRVSNGLHTINGLKVSNGLTSNGLQSANGLHTINGLKVSNGLTSNGLQSANGITSNGLHSANGISSNGLQSANGLKVINGISSNGVAPHRFRAVAPLLPNGSLRSNALMPVAALEPSVSASANAFDALLFRGRRLAPEGEWLAESVRYDQGLSVGAGLDTDAGLASGIGLMSSDDGRLVASYLVKCALPPGRSISKYDEQGNVQVFDGAIGVAPEWETRACGSDCQEWVTACLLSHVNLTGRHVSIWLTAENPAVDWSTSTEFPNQEAAFFGNIFAARPEAYICHGDDVAVDPIPGRVCDGSKGCPYANPYVSIGGACTSRSACAEHASVSGSVEGYESCTVGKKTWSRVMTTWKP